MPEDTFVIQDGRSILVQFSAAPSATGWGWFGMRGADGLEFATAASPWSEQDWLLGKGMLMAGGTPPAGGAVPLRMLMKMGT